MFRKRLRYHWITALVFLVGVSALAYAFTLIYQGQQRAEGDKFTAAAADTTASIKLHFQSVVDHVALLGTAIDTIGPSAVKSFDRLAAELQKLQPELHTVAYATQAEGEGSAPLLEIKEIYPRGFDLEEWDLLRRQALAKGIEWSKEHRQPWVSDFFIHHAHNDSQVSFGVCLVMMPTSLLSQGDEKGENGTSGLMLALVSLEDLLAVTPIARSIDLYLIDEVPSHPAVSLSHDGNRSVVSTVEGATIEVNGSLPFERQKIHASNRTVELLMVPAGEAFTAFPLLSTWVAAIAGLIVILLTTLLVGGMRHRIAILYQTAEELKAASELKSSFLGRFSHELRTPLHTVIGYIELVLEQLPVAQRSELERDLASARAAAWSVSFAINTILDATKLSMAKPEKPLGPLPLSSLIASIVDMTMPIIQESGNAFSLSSGCRRPVQIIDGQRFSTILINILTYATEVTRNGEIKLSTDCGDGQILAQVLCHDSCPKFSKEEIEGFQQPVTAPLAPQGLPELTQLKLRVAYTYAQSMGGTFKWLNLEDGIGIAVSLPIQK